VRVIGADAAKATAAPVVEQFRVLFFEKIGLQRLVGRFSDHVAQGSRSFRAERDLARG
jgi:hypothetical protein